MVDMRDFEYCSMLEKIGITPIPSLHYSSLSAPMKTSDVESS